MAQFQRSSGIILHPSSLPGRHGIGELGTHAYQWIDFLVTARQTIWQILPLGPTGYGNSPYQTTSVFAGNPLFLDMDSLRHEGLLPDDYEKEMPHFPENRVDFEAVINWKLPLLSQAYSRFAQSASPEERQRFEEFLKQHDQLWLHNYALFMALKERFGGQAWNRWPEGYKNRDPHFLSRAAEELSGQIISHKFCQYLFFKQWTNLRSYANERGVRILGDIPIYVTFDSAEVWATQDRFDLDEQGNPGMVAGVPPDYFSETGQLWGNPIYDWKAMEAHGFQWWIDRVRVTLDYVDYVRMDHFRGFEAYWAVPFGEETAVKGKWVKGPGSKLFDALIGALGEIPLVVEDLGFITPEVEALRDHYNFPGMKILQFAFGNGPKDPYLPHNFPQNCVVYTGSHDNDTTLGWYQSAPAHEQEFCRKYIGGLRESISWEMIRLAASSTAVMSLYPLQDVLALGSEARMNVPGKASGNWGWRYQSSLLSEARALRLAEISEIYGRVPGK